MIRRQDLSHLLGRPFGSEDTTNERPKKDKNLRLLTSHVKIHSRASDPVKKREHEHHSGAADPLRTLETKDAKYGHKTLNKNWTN